MRCKRCRGLVVVESTAGGQVDEMSCELRGWRCLNCGAMVDVRMLRMKASSRSRPLKPDEATEEKNGRRKAECPRIFTAISQARHPR